MHNGYRNKSQIMLLFFSIQNEKWCYALAQHTRLACALFFLLSHGHTEMLTCNNQKVGTRVLTAGKIEIESYVTHSMDEFTHAISWLRHRLHYSLNSIFFSLRFHVQEMKFMCCNCTICNRNDEMKPGLAFTMNVKKNDEKKIIKSIRFMNPRKWRKDEMIFKPKSFISTAYSHLEQSQTKL